MNPNDNNPSTSADPPQAASPAAPDLPPTDAVAPAEAVAPKPRRRRVTAALASDAAAVAAVPEDVAISAAAHEAPAQSKDAHEAPQPLADAPLPAAAALDAAPTLTEADGADDDGQRRRNRNRRRGRRGDDSPLPEGATVLTISAGADDDDDDDHVASEAVGDGQASALEMATAGEAGAAAVAVPAMPVDASETFADVLSGAFDAEPVVSPEAATDDRRVLSAEPDSPKLHKVLAQAGIGSRRDMEELIASGQVQVNGEVAHTGQRISFGDRISVGGRVIQVRIVPGPARVLAYHKLVGEVVTHDDPQQRPTVFRRLPRLQHGKWQSVGRLDINTEGLLLFTNSGELANQLMHPRFGVEREYAVRVLGRLDDNGRARLLEGVEIDGQRAAFKSVEDGGGEGANHWYRVVINEGRNREVRKLFDKVGLGVSRLIRIRYGCVVLPRGLKRGVFVDLHGGEVAQLRSLASPRGGPGGAQRGQPGPPPPREPRREIPAEGRQDVAMRDGQRLSDNRERNDQAFGGVNNKRNRRGKRGNDPRDRSPQGQPGGGGFAGPNPGTNAGQSLGQSPGQFAGPRNGPRAPYLDRGADRPPRQIAERPPRREPDRDLSREPAHEFSREPDRDRDDPIDFRAIPNPLMQTFDKRAIRDARQPRREIAEDGPIPNPLEQTFDKRFVQKPRGFGGDGPRQGGQGGPGGNGGQPDPMKTSVGYIGADAFVRKFQSSGAGGGGGGGGFGGGGGGGGGGGNRGGGKRGGRR